MYIASNFFQYQAEGLICILRSSFSVSAQNSKQPRILAPSIGIDFTRSFLFLFSSFMFSNISIECLFSSFKLCNISIECKPGMFLRCCCPPMYCTWGHFRLNTKWIIQGLRSNIPFAANYMLLRASVVLLLCSVCMMWYFAFLLHVQYQRL